MKNYDVIIIGKGPAGLSASLYTARGNMKTLIIGKTSVLTKGERIENYCCTEPESGEDLIAKGVDQAKSFGVEMVEEDVLDIKKEDDFIITTDKNKYSSKSIIIATGQDRKQIPIKNIEKYENKGVHYCAVCDGFFYTDKKVGILGYTDYAIHELMEIRRNTKEITLLTNGKELDVSEKNKQFLEENNIEVNRKKVQSTEGDEALAKIIYQDGKEEKFDGIFVAYGSASSIDFARKLGIMTENDSIKVDASQQTNIEGVFAAGDCTGGLTQVATAVGQGAVAGQKVKAYVQ